MKKKALLFALSASLLITAWAFAPKADNIYRLKEGKVSFFSKAPLEDIAAEAKSYAGVINLTNRKVAFQVFITSFEFPNKTMQEHFNENYMESEKYPKATFSGTINEEVDLTKNGTYQVSVAGKLTIHGVEQERTIPGVITMKEGLLSLTSDFKVKLEDHKIKVPSVVVSNIAEVIDVKIAGTFEPKK